MPKCRPSDSRAGNLGSSSSGIANFIPPANHVRCVLGAIYWARISRIYFANTAEDAASIGFDDSFIYRELKEIHSHRRIPAIQMMHEEALAGFRLWLEKPGKIPY